jgi:hypothetical protein
MSDERKSETRETVTVECDGRVLTGEEAERFLRDLLGHVGYVGQRRRGE